MPKPVANSVEDTNHLLREVGTARYQSSNRFNTPLRNFFVATIYICGMYSAENLTHRKYLQPSLWRVALFPANNTCQSGNSFIRNRQRGSECSSHTMKSLTS